MKIAIISPKNYADRQPGSCRIDQHTKLLELELERQGHDVHVYLLSADQFSNQSSTPKLLSSNALLSELKVGGFDVVHNSCLQLIPLAQMHQLPCKVVTTLQAPPKSAEKAGVLLANLAFNHHYVAVSEYVAKQWEDIIGYRCSVIYQGVEEERWEEIYAPYLRTAVWSGSICPDKGTAQAISAAKEAGFRLKIAGPIVDQAYFEREVKPALGRNVTYVGDLAWNDLAPHLGHSQCGLVTNMNEHSYGITAAEMTTLGLPVVAFGTGSVAELVKESTGFIVAKNDIETMAGMMKATQQTCRLRCRNHSQASFSGRQMGMFYGNFFNQLMDPAMVTNLPARATVEKLGKVA